MLESILVIDDDTDARQSIAFTLESQDYLVFSAGDEDTALIMARRANPRVIFANLAVAGGKGLQICKRIHGMEQLKNVPIIVLSAFEGAKDPHFTSLYGIVDSLQKPFSPEDLSARVKDALSLTPSDMQPVVDLVDSGTADGRDPDEAVEVSEAPRKDEEQPQSIVNPPDHEPEEEAPAEQEDPYASKRIIGSTGFKTRMPAALVAAVAIVVLGAVGFMFYSKGVLLETKAPEKTVRAKNDRPPQQTAQVNHPPVPQKQLADAGNETPAKPEVPAAPPVAPKLLPKPESPVAPPADSRPVKSKVPDTLADKQETGLKETDKTVYSVQVGVFKSRKNASALTRRYEKKGYEAFTHKTSTDEKKILYRVLIGKFANKREAVGWARKIGAEEHITTMVFKR